MRRNPRPSPAEPRHARGGRALSIGRGRPVLAVALALGALWQPLGAWAGAPFGPSNPFHAPSTLPYGAPPFDRIRDEDYRPAIEAGMVQQRSQIRVIADDPRPATFDNTLLALEKSGALLQRALAAFDAVSQANTNPVLQAAKAALAPQLAAHRDALYLNARLFRRIQAIRSASGTQLDPESRRLLEVTYEEFAHSGATLDAAGQRRLKALNAEASTLSNDFTEKLLAATKAGAFQTEDRGALAGLDEAQVAAASQTARSRGAEGYVLALQNTTQQPAFVALSERDTRRALFENSWKRAERGDANDTRALVARLAQLRAERAALLGFANHAAWKLSDQMAKTPDAARAFLDTLAAAARPKAGGEKKNIQDFIDARHGGFALAAWDWKFYEEQVRKATFDLDDAVLQPYFELDRVLVDGVFYAANLLYGITFIERKDLPVYHPDVRVFEVHDRDGTPLALFYGDYFKRDNKNGGAWMSSFVEESTLLGTRPVIYNVANLPKPGPGQPALISVDDVRTVFHEFGHALHGMFANTRYPSLSGTATARDFVEFPSQFNEHWAMYPAVFDHYARHRLTGAAMPAELKDKVQRSENFGTGFRLAELLAAAELDLQWHLLPASAPRQDPDLFEAAALERTHLNDPALPPRYRSTYFSHIWAGGYSAGYYAYLWTQMLDDDAYQWFEENGGLTRANGDRFRDMVLSRGNTEDLAAMYARWRGRAPTPAAMLKYRRLSDPLPAPPR